MNRYHIVIDGRVYEGWYRTIANAVFGALRKDEQNRPQSGNLIALPEDTDVNITVHWQEQDETRRSTGIKRLH